MMDRRAFITFVGGSILAAPLAREAQQPKVARLGYLVTGSLESPEVRARRDAFRTGLRELGYLEGQDIVLEYRGADSKIGVDPVRWTVNCFRNCSPQRL
jgi:putative ABC transport system substrate-binding protein